MKAKQNSRNAARAGGVVVALTIAALWLQGCSTDGPVSTSGGAMAANGYVSVSGTHLMRNGVVWVPHGLNSVAFVPSPAVRTGAFGAAYKAFSPTELAAMQAWGADTIRFQVSQAALDKDDPTVPSLYDPPRSRARSWPL